MSRKDISFQKLFRQADEFVGIDKQPPLRQVDTSIFDVADEDENGNEKKLLIAEDDLVAFKNVVKIVQENKILHSDAPKYVKTAIHNTESNVFQSSLFDVNKHKTLPSYQIPSISWEKEVLMMLEKDRLEAENEVALNSNENLKLGITNTSDRKSEKINKLSTAVDILLPPRLFHGNIAPSFCFDTDSITLNEALRDEYDELENLIPNVNLDDAIKVVNGNIVNIIDESDDDDNDKEIKDKIASIDAETKVPEGVTSKSSQEPHNLSKAERNKLMVEEKVRRISNVTIGGEEAAISVISRSLGSKQPKDDYPLFQSRSKMRTMLSILNHHPFAVHHKNTKMDLSEHELRYLHRPRVAKSLKNKLWQITMRNPLKQRFSSKNSGFSGINSITTSISESNKQDLSLLQGDYILMEYIEEAPPILLNYGMASTIINYYRMSEKPRDNDDNVTQTKYRNMEKTLAKNRLIGSLNISQNSIGLGGSSYRIPRHVQLLLQQRNQRQLYDTDDTHIPKLPYGETKVLTQDNESPFLGEIAEDEIIQSMMNNLFRSPIVQHKPNPTDFLLIHTKILAKSVLYSIREIPAIFISGQTEPQKIVPRPIRNGLSRVQERMLMLGIARYLLTMPNGANLTEIQDHILKFYRRKRFLYGPGGIKKLLKDRIADEIITNSGKKWISKELVSHDGHGNHPSYHRTVDYDDYEEDTKNIEKQYTVEELIKSFTPEDVCLQESCNAAELRLLSYGIIDIELQRVRQWLERMKRLKDCRIDNAAKLKMIVNDKMMQLNSISSRPNNDQLNTLVMKLNKVLRILLNDIKKLDEKIKLGQFVYGRLLIAPWNTTEAYVKSHIEKDGLGKMELSGQGDPSGRGEGFAFVRLLKIDSGQKKSTDKLVHTDKDLRKLTRPDLHRLLKGFGMTEAELKTLKRWDMVHLVREHSTKAESRGLSSAMHKYARGNNTATSYRHSSYREQAQEIWKRQMKVLSTSSSHLHETTDVEDDDDSDSDWSIEEKLGLGEDIDMIVKRRASKLTEELRGANVAKQAALAADEQRIWKTMKQNLFGGEGVRTDGTSMKGLNTSSYTKIDENDRSKVASNEAHIKKLIEKFGRPAKVVKQIFRTFQDNGQETIEIKFLISKHEVDRVEYHKEQEQAKKVDQNNADDVVFDYYGDENEGETDDKMKKPAELKIKYKRNVDDVNDGGNDDAFDERLYQPSKIASRGATVATNVNIRMPHVRLAAKFEKELMIVWKKKQASWFRDPVPDSVAGYYDMIKNPICLRDIRNKIVSYQYGSVQSILNDIQLMVHNAEEFNGKNTVIVADANSVYCDLQLAFTHDKKFLGAAKDEYTILENAIRKKYLLWGREPPAIEVSKPLSQNITSSNQIKRTSRNSTAAMIDGEAMKSLPQENKKTVKKPNAEPSKKKKVPTKSALKSNQSSSASLTTVKDDQSNISTIVQISHVSVAETKSTSSSPSVPPLTSSTVQEISRVSTENVNAVDKKPRERTSSATSTFLSMAMDYSDDSSGDEEVMEEG